MEDRLATTKRPCLNVCMCVFVCVCVPVCMGAWVCVTVYMTKSVCGTPSNGVDVASHSAHASALSFLQLHPFGFAQKIGLVHLVTSSVQESGCIHSAVGEKTIILLFSGCANYNYYTSTPKFANWRPLLRFGSLF